MDKAQLFNLKDSFICPVDRSALSWKDSFQGHSEAGASAVWEDDTWVIRCPGCPEIPAEPEYTSSNPYHTDCLKLIDACQEGLVLNWGAGSPRFSFPNVLETEIRKYPSTDVVSTAAQLPFANETFEGVISLSVLEHVRDPFEHVAEIYRVLKPGGKLVLHAAFMQPFHGAPHHYFNLTRSAYECILEKFTIESLDVGTHQHPWIMLRWVLNSYLTGLETEAEQSAFRALSVGEILDRLGAIEGARAAVKQLESPQAIASELRNFNANRAQDLFPFLTLKKTATDELAAGFCATATKPS